MDDITGFVLNIKTPCLVFSAATKIAPPRLAGFKNDKGKVVKVNFGFGGKSAKGKRMVIKDKNPKRRAAYRARHNCKNPGPKWKANYWSCKAW